MWNTGGLRGLGSWISVSENAAMGHKVERLEPEDDGNSRFGSSPFLKGLILGGSSQDL